MCALPQCSVCRAVSAEATCRAETSEARERAVQS